MNQQELDEVVWLHNMWLRDEEGGERAVLKGANLRGAKLRDMVLNRADFRGADLSEADLALADLRKADLREAKLTGANLYAASLCGADLSGADFGEANLDDASLSEAVLSGATGLPAVPSVEGLVLRVLSLVDANPDALEMDEVHNCATTHCLAGWAVTLAGPDGAELEKKLGWNAAGALIFHASCGMVPDFYSTNEGAIEWLNKNARRSDG